MLRKLLGLGNKENKQGEVSSIEDPLLEFRLEEARISEAGSVNGKHFTSYVDQIKQLKREEKHQEAVELLLKICDATEAESEVSGLGVAPWYYEQLAIIYRREKRFTDEVAILERYEAQPKALGAGPKKLADRLVKARKIADEIK